MVVMAGLMAVDGPPIAVVLVAMAASSLGSVYQPAAAAMTPQLVPERDLASANAGQGAALLGSQALGGSPRAVPQTKLRDQLLAVLNHLNAHIASNDHDARYVRNVFYQTMVIPAVTTKTMGVASASPQMLHWAYNLVTGANDDPVQPQYHNGPLSSQLQVWLDKSDSSGNRIWARNNSNTKVFLAVAAYTLN